jgi:hypothetical protein
MKNITAFLLQDPVLLISAAVFLGTIVILIWAITSLKKASIEDDPLGQNSELNEEKVSDENQEVVGARLREISNQICDLTQKIADFEKNNKQMLQSDKTMKLDPSQALPNESAAKVSEALERLDAKLDGILKLLVNLTDSSGSDQR